MKKLIWKIRCSIGNFLYLWDFRPDSLVKDVCDHTSELLGAGYFKRNRKDPYHHGFQAYWFPVTDDVLKQDIISLNFRKVN